MKKPKVSIVILAWNNVDDVRQCIESIQESYQSYYQLIVIDNGSTDETPKYLKTLQTQWEYDKGTLDIVLNEHNLGYAAGNNSALSRIQGEYTLWLNQDIVVTPDSIHILEKCLDDYLEYAMVAPQLRYPDDTIQDSCRNLPLLSQMIQSTLKGKWKDNFDYHISQECEQPMASAIMIRSIIMQEIGGFDEHPDYWLFFNDVDLSKKLKEKHYKTYYVANAIMYHHHGGSTKKLLNITKRIYWQRGFNRYFRKWYYQYGYKKYLLYILSGILFSLLMIRDFFRR